jgi:hypothetical protein
MTVWCRAGTVDADGSPTPRQVVIEGAGAPGLAAIAELARWVLEARRAGEGVFIESLAPAMADLLDLAGLGPASLGIEVQGEPERREEPLRIQRMEEEGQLGDLPA